jgi:uncharacterized protein
MNSMNGNNVFSDGERQLLERIRCAITAVEPSAAVYLYGSRARGEATEESDWDVLVLLDGAVSYQRKRAIWHTLSDLELETLTIITATVKSREEWSGNGLLQATPFYQNVTHDSVRL